MLRTIMEAMHRGVVTCRVAATVDEVIGIMLDNHIHALVVIDEGLDACGVVTKTDLVRCYGKDLSSITAEDIMNPTLLTVSPDTLVHDAVQQMLTHKVHQLVIVTEADAHHRPVGIFTIADVVTLMAGESGPQS